MRKDLLFGLVGSFGQSLNQNQKTTSVFSNYDFIISASVESLKNVLQVMAVKTFGYTTIDYDSTKITYHDAKCGAKLTLYHRNFKPQFCVTEINDLSNNPLQILIWCRNNVTSRSEHQRNLSNK